MIRTKIRKFREDAVPGPDGISPGLLKLLEEQVLLPLEIIFNKSLTTGRYLENGKPHM
jgi:hypothetical protein